MSKEKILHFQGFNSENCWSDPSQQCIIAHPLTFIFQVRKEVHNSRWQTPRSPKTGPWRVWRVGSNKNRIQIHDLRVTRLKINMKFWNSILKPLMPVPSHIFACCFWFFLWIHSNQSKWTTCETSTPLTTSNIFHIPTIHQEAESYFECSLPWLDRTSSKISRLWVAKSHQLFASCSHSTIEINTHTTDCWIFDILSLFCTSVLEHQNNPNS